VIAGWQVYEGTTPNWFLEPLLRGVADGARALGCDVLLACGLGTPIGDPRGAHPAWPEPGDEGDFVPVGAWNTDGLVVISPLRTDARREHVRGLAAAGHPVVFVGGGDGQPAVRVDNALGIRLALAHLAGHGHRRVAFVAGDPRDAGDSRARLEAFLALRSELGLEPDDALVVEGLHSEAGGYDAMRALLERGHPFTAVLASNDVSAIGTMRALLESGLDVPEDVAVVGFDDHLRASAHVPPLATIRYPLYEAGRRAVELLIERMLGGEGLPAEVAIPPTFAGRRSCGCLPCDAAAQAPPVDLDVGPEALPQAIARDMAAAAARAGSSLKQSEAEAASRRLVGGLQWSLGEGTPAAFERGLTELLQRLEAAGDGAHPWQSALSRLRLAVPAVLGPVADDAVRAEAEGLLHVARLALGESVLRQGLRQRVVDSERADRVSALSVPLQAAHDETEVLRLLHEHAPGLGARPIALALYEGGEPDPVAWSRVRLLDGWTPVPGAEPLRVETRRVLPDLLPRGEAPRLLAVLPLVQQGATRGFVAFEAATLEPCAAIARPLAVALEAVRLQAAVRALTVTDELTGLHNRRFFESELRRESERARRFGRRLALVLVDVDHFKRYNDSFGHRAGDAALREVAGCLLAAARRVDAVTRYGGEEFAVLLAETDTEGARHVGERIRDALAASRGLRGPLTISAGVASLEGEAVEGEELVRRADEALYAAKREGRDRVCLAAD
jgi:diguanylate cyclase (GGDEF)-like protein